MTEEPDSYQLDQVREEWKLMACEVLESGPERATLWTRWGGARSWVDLTFSVSREISGVRVKGRLLWNQRSARLQLVLPSTGPAECDVPGSVATRTERGQVPVGRWFQRTNGDGDTLGIASDVLSDADFLPQETRLTLARATRYADDQKTGPSEKMWLPAADCGELKFQLGLYSTGTSGDQASHSLLSPPVSLMVTPGPGASWPWIARLDFAGRSAAALRADHSGWHPPAPAESPPQGV